MARPRPTLRPSGHEYSANRYGRGGYGSRLSTLGTSRIDATHGVTDDSSRASPSAQPTLKTQYVIGRTLSSNVVDTVRIILIFCGSPIITRLVFSALTAERQVLSNRLRVKGS